MISKYLENIEKQERKEEQSTLHLLFEWISIQLYLFVGKEPEDFGPDFA
jgi:hypothetical protein